MNAIAMALACAIVGVDAGYQPIEGGGVEYIIQIEPHLLPILLDGQQITSNVPRDLDVRRYRITVGTAKVPRENPQPRENPLPRENPGLQEAGPQPHRATRPVSGDPSQDSGISGDGDGLQVAFQPAVAGGEYTVSIRPKLLDQLLEGNDLSGDLPNDVEVRRFCVTTAPLGQAIAKAGQRPAVDDGWRHDPVDDLAADGPAGIGNHASESVIEPLSDSNEMVDPIPLPDKRHILPSNPLAHQPSGDPFRPDYDAADRAKRGAAAALDSPLTDVDGGDGAGKASDRSSASAAPNRFQPDPRSERLTQRASFDGAGQSLEPVHKHEPSSVHSADTPIAPGHATSAGTNQPATHARPTASESKPWLPLTLTLLLLCGSIGANVFLGWVAWGARQQCRELLDKLRTVPVSN